MIHSFIQRDANGGMGISPVVTGKGGYPSPVVTPWCLCRTR